MGLKLGDASPALSNGFSQEAHEQVDDGIMGIDPPDFSKGVTSSAERGVSEIVFNSHPPLDLAISFAQGRIAASRKK